MAYRLVVVTAVAVLLVSTRAGVWADTGSLGARVGAGCPAGRGKTYEVSGQGKLRQLGDVPWDHLGPGDRVLVAWRPEPYREQILISERGKPDEPIRVCGVPGPQGQLPIITGENAHNGRALGLPYAPTQQRGVVILSLRKGQRWGEKPAYVVLDGLDVRGAHPGHWFTDESGTRLRFTGSAASIFIERGEHIMVRNCAISDSANGLFVASGDSEQTLSREIVIEGNYIYGNGIVDSCFQHNAYSEAAGITYQRNRFGSLRPGAGGNALKDRSAGTVIRYNWVQGGAHLLDLVEPEDSVKLTTPDPRFRQTFVYGNVLINGERDGGNLVHYGGDNGKEETYRKGTLFFFNNTVVVRGEQSTRWNTSLLKLETNDETADLRNNILVHEGSTHFFLSAGPGRLRLGANWVTAGFGMWERKVPGMPRTEGKEHLVSGTGNPFVDLAHGDLRVRPDVVSAVVAGPQAPELPPSFLPNRQYQPHLGERSRGAPGTPPLMGALD